MKVRRTLCAVARTDRCRLRPHHERGLSASLDRDVLRTIHNPSLSAGTILDLEPGYLVVDERELLVFLEGIQRVYVKLAKRSLVGVCTVTHMVNIV